MAEYIEREALSKWLHENMSAQTTTVGMACVRDFWNKVLDTPAADVVPVVHGRWTFYFSHGYDEYEYKCSACNDWANQRYQYCPYCGAKMDG